MGGEGDRYKRVLSIVPLTRLALLADLSPQAGEVTELAAPASVNFHSPHALNRVAPIAPLRLYAPAVAPAFPNNPSQKMSVITDPLFYLLRI